MSETALMRLARAAQSASPFETEPQESEWLSGVLSAVWGGAPGDDMPAAFNQGYRWSQRWLAENQAPINSQEPGADPSPWQTGTPPGPGWYMVTAEWPEHGRFVMQAFYSPENSYWRQGSEPMGAHQWPSLGIGQPVPVLAWMPLPEPYRGEGA